MTYRTRYARQNRVAESSALMMPLVRINVERLAELERCIVWII